MDFFKEVTSATTDPTYVFNNTQESNELDFEYVPGKDDPGHAEILKAQVLSGTLILVW